MPGHVGMGTKWPEVLKPQQASTARQEQGLMPDGEY
jgi:hypothetical protein